MKKFQQNVILMIISLSGLIAIGWWVSVDPSIGFTGRIQGMDNRGKASAASYENIKIGEFFKSFTEEETTTTENWPRFRGSNYDNISKTGRSLISKFKSREPRIIWSVDLGEGHAGAAIYNGQVYIFDYDEEQKADMLRCFSLKSGKELWRRWYNIHVKRNHGMSRTVPAVTKNFIVTIGPRCHVMCVERETGNYLWGIDVEKEYQSEVPLWYTGQCPLIVNDTAVIATGGKALLIGIDCATGKKVWETRNPGKWKMSHSSVIPFTFKEKKMYVYSAVGGICGIAANGTDMGQVSWKSSAWDHSVVAPSPLCLPNGKIFLTAGYGAGSMVLQLEETRGEFSIEVLQEYKPSKGFACEQQTAVFADGYVFGILPKDAGSLRNQFVCVHPDDFTKIVWSSGKSNRFGLGPYLLADNKFYLLNDDATLFIIGKNTKKYVQLDSLKLFEGHDAWAPLALADGYLILRDSKKMVCINIGND